jgi:hypothetical protein
MLRRFFHFSVLVAAIAGGCSRGPAAPESFGITPPASWGPVAEDKRGDWSGEMAASTKDVIDALASQYQSLSKKAVVEEQTVDRLVVKIDLADLVQAVSRELGTDPGPPSTKPLYRRLLIEVVPDRNNFAVRTRTFDVAS